MRLMYPAAREAPQLADDLSALGERLPPGLDVAAASAALRTSAGHALSGMPVVLTRAGQYEEHINAFLRSLPSGFDDDGVWSAGRTTQQRATWRAAASDIVMFVDWVEEERGKPFVEADVSDARAYHRARQVDSFGEGAAAVESSTWNRQVAYLDRFYVYLGLKNLSQSNPFRIGATPAFRSRRRPTRKIKWLSLEAYEQWVQGGLLGEMGTRRYPLSATRDKTFTDLLVRTGMRVGEAASLLVDDVPIDRSSSARISLGAGATKNHRDRTVMLSGVGFRDLREWIDVDRAALTEQWVDGHPTDRLLVGERTRTGRLRLDGRERPVEAQVLSASARHRLALRGDDGGLKPALLWLNRDGSPTTAAAWTSVFRRANERCAKAGIRTRVSPHMLRHTFAVHMLSLLLEESLSEVSRLVSAGGRGRDLRLRRLLDDPIRQLQLRLGHVDYRTGVRNEPVTTDR